jgi:histidinol-phosphate aminotransferase
MIDPPPVGSDTAGVAYIASNESAHGPSPAALAAAAEALSIAERYPEGGPERLAAAIARRFDLDRDRIVCGNGSDDILARLARAFLRPGDELIHSVHGYPKTPNYAHACDAVPVAVPDRDFTVDVDAVLAALTAATRMVMVANPDNPTGTYLPEAEIRRLHRGLPGDVLLVLDCAYAEYVDAGDYGDPARLVEATDNVVMTRTFSKIFGLAGLRVGWMYAAPEVADVVRRIGITFPITEPSVRAAIAALDDVRHTGHVFEENRTIRQWFAGQLDSLGLDVVSSQTNFVLVRFPEGRYSAEAAAAFLERNGVIARRFTAPAFAAHLRFTIGRRSEMERAAAALKLFLDGGH